ncbi:hypothetical protein D3C77_571850 [compost metagenome]
MNEHFAFAHHAQFTARTLFDGPGAPFKIAHFSFQRRIARAQAFIGLALLGHLALQIPDLEPAALTQPQRVLDQAYQHEQHQEQQAHTREPSEQSWRGCGGGARRCHRASHQRRL